jgi:hypothetical protein
MSNTTRIAGLKGYLVIARAQAKLSVQDIAFSLQRDYAMSTDEAIATAQVVKSRGRLAAAQTRKQLAALKK